MVYPKEDQRDIVKRYSIMIAIRGDSSSSKSAQVAVGQGTKFEEFQDGVLRRPVWVCSICLRPTKKGAMRIRVNVEYEFNDVVKELNF